MFLPQDLNIEFLALIYQTVLQTDKVGVHEKLTLSRMATRDQMILSAGVQKEQYFFKSKGNKQMNRQGTASCNQLGHMKASTCWGRKGNFSLSFKEK